MLQRRVQILMDESRYSRLESIARERNQSVAAVIRSLVDQMLPVAERRRRDAGNRILERARLAGHAHANDGVSVRDVVEQQSDERMRHSDPAG